MNHGDGTSVYRLAAGNHQLERLHPLCTQLLQAGTRRDWRTFESFSSGSVGPLLRPSLACGTTWSGQSRRVGHV